MITFWIVFAVVGLITTVWFVSACEGDGILMGLFLSAIVGLMAGGIATGIAGILQFTT